MTTVSATPTLAERARAAYRQREEDDARRLAARRERDRKQCQVALAKILEMPVDSIDVMDGPPRRWNDNHPPFPFQAAVDDLQFVFQVSGDPAARTITVHLVPTETMPSPLDKPLDNPLEHYSSRITSLADLGGLLEYFEPYYL